MTTISGSFQKLTKDQAITISRELGDAWKDPRIPRRQYDLAVKPELEQYKKGAACKAFSAFVECLLQLPDGLDVPETKLLEVGASSGYYGEVMRLAGFKMTYEALDWSEAFRDLAKELYPQTKFHVGDARKLELPDSSYDIVASGCVIIHSIESDMIVKETARVTKKYAIFHRTPIAINNVTEYYQKLAYDIPCFEVHYGEDQLHESFSNAGLKSLYRVELFRDPASNYANYTYLLEKE
jgi:ubiquinone/menaquinone biosynthesis C-methylase UbiE